MLFGSSEEGVGSHLGCKLVASERLENEHKSGACKLLRELRNSLLCMFFLCLSLCIFIIILLSATHEGEGRERCSVFNIKMHFN